MGRQANFSELRDAIRQGQAKIAQGLKTGQMRADGERAGRGEVSGQGPAYRAAGQKGPLTEKVSLFQGRKKPKFRFSLPKLPKLPKIRIPMPRVAFPPMRSVLSGVVAVLGIAFVVFVVFWIGKALTGGPSSEPVAPDVGTGRPTASPQAPQTPVTEPDPAVRRPPREVPAQPDPEPTPPPPPRNQWTGNNVIVIQGITAARQDELIPVQEFFARHGVPTEIIRGANNYSQLVTRDRFENPSRAGTDGYQMRMRIREVGRRYPDETGDTKFGREPFQDAYGLLIQD